MDFGTILDASVSAALGPQAIVLILAAIGLNIHFGYTGLLNFGQAAFVAVGAYGVSVSVLYFNTSFWVGTITALAASLLLSVILGVPTLRLRADYLGIVTIAAAEAIRLVFGSVELQPILGGSNGLNSFNRQWNDLNPYSSGIDIGIASWSAQAVWAMTVGWLLIAVFTLLTWLLVRSPWGRVLRSIREDEEAVRSLGKNVFSAKMQALMLGGLIGSVAGIFNAAQQGSVVPTDYSTILTFYAWTALLLGGAGRVLGPVVGGMLFWFLLSGIGSTFGQLTSGSRPILPEWFMSSEQASLVRYVLLGLALMALMIFRPQGIFGDRKEIAIDAR